MLTSKAVAASRSRRVFAVAVTVVAMAAVSTSSVQAAPAASASKPASPPAPSNAPPKMLPAANLPAIPASGVPVGAAQLAQANKLATVTATAPDAFAGPAPAPAVGAAVPTTEMPAQRTATSKTFATTTAGQFVSQAYSGPVQYRGTDGTMHDVDPTLVAAGPGRYAANAAAVGVNLAASPTDTDLATVTFDAGHSVSYGLIGARPGAPASPRPWPGPRRRPSSMRALCPASIWNWPAPKAG